MTPSCRPILVWWWVVGMGVVVGCFVNCSPLTPPCQQTEICNGKDDDCDGQIDNRCGFFWATSAGGKSLDGANSITTDGAGNLYITGVFSGTAVFGSTTLFSQGERDVFVAKLSQQGMFLWAVSAGGTKTDHASSITTDSSGNIYITGYFGETAVFGSTTLSSQTTKVFVAKLSHQGTFLWAVSTDGLVTSITTDSERNLYITGGFNGTAVFGRTTLSSPSVFGTTVFAAKLSDQGVFLWAVPVGTRDSIDLLGNIIRDGVGNLYITGSFSKTAVFGSTIFSSQGGSDVFVAKLSDQGTLLWAVTAGGTKADHASSITTDNAGNLYITGYFSGTAVFGSTTLSSQGEADVFVAKLSDQGMFLWAVSAGGVSSAVPRSVAVDGVGNLYITGVFNGTAVFGSTTISSQGDRDVFVAKLSDQGMFLWAVSAGGTKADHANSITTDSSGNLYITGSFGGTAVFGSTTLSSQGETDVFVAKLR